jgi:hypothetical protein
MLMLQISAQFTLPESNAEPAAREHVKIDNNKY